MILGIDLGTTQSAVGVVDSGFPILLADRDGRRTMPSAVWFGEDGEVEVGRKALARRGADPQRVVTSVKRLMGDSGFVGDVGRTPEEVSAEILKELRRTAEWRLGCEVEKAVITVPAYFNEGQRAATKSAAELAGLEVVRMINEPTAAALAYGLDQKGEGKRRVAVYDLGGGTFDLTVLEIEDGVFQVLSTCGDTELGGDDLDLLLAERILELAGRGGADVSEEVREAAGKAKHRLSEEESVAVQILFYEGDGHLDVEVSRQMLEDVAEGWLGKTIRCCKQAMLDSGIGVEDLDEVVLVGGSTRMPAVREVVEKFFKKTPDLTQHPDEAIALGATIQAGVMSGALRKMVLLDVTPLSLGLESYGGLMNVIIPRNTTIPCKAGEMFTNAAEGQTGMSVKVLQGEREMARDNWEIGKFLVPLKPMVKGKARVGVQFKIDADGLLEVLARDTETGEDTILKIESSAVDVEDEQVEAMVGESVTHAFEDMSERIFTEASLKADELVPAVKVLLEGDGMDAGERERIEAALKDVEVARAGGSANDLKAAVGKLDSETEEAAARLVEAAMEEALAKEMGI